MPATRRNTAGAPSSAASSAAPYSLAGASKPQLTALTVAALKSHLKHFKLSTTGKKSELVDRLHSHLHSSQQDSTTESQVTVNSSSQQDAQDVTVNTQTDPESPQNAPHQALPQQFLDQL